MVQFPSNACVTEKDVRLAYTAGEKRACEELASFRNDLGAVLEAGPVALIDDRGKELMLRAIELFVYASIVRRMTRSYPGLQGYADAVDAAHDLTYPSFPV